MGIKALGNVSVLNVNDGQNGAPGQRGASVSASSPQYYLSTSPSNLNGGQWEDSPREVTTGTYLWERIKTTLDDGTIVYSNAVYSATISGVKHDVDQINNSITNRVWQSDINSSINSYDGSTVSSIRDRVTQTETDITGITSRVSDVESETDDLGTRMSSAESSITQNANNIALKVSADGVISSINQSPEQITISADKVNIAGAAIFDSYSLKSQTVSDFSVMYAKSTDPDTFTPVSGADGQWSVNAPEWEAGKYIWQRTAKTINGSTNYSYTCIQGASGESSYTYVRYSANANGSGMVTSPSSATKYIGIYTGNSPTVPAYTAFTWSKYIGEDGDPGSPGTSSYTYVRYSANSDGSSMTSSPQSNSKYIGIYTGTSSTAPSTASSYTWSQYRGNDGTSVSITSITYAISDTEDKPSDSSFTYDSIPTVAEGKWLWTKTEYSSGNKLYTKSKQGLSGNSVSISSITYAVTDTDQDPQSFPYSSAPSVSEGQWLWTKVTFSDNNTVVTKAKQGISGTSYYTHIRYSVNSSGNPMVSTPTDDTIYIGIYSGTSSTAPTSYGSYTWSRYAGKDGTNKVTVYLYQRAASAPSKPSSTLTYTFSTGALTGTLGNWQQTIPSNTNDTNPVWMTIATASAIATATTDTISSSEWSAPVEYMKDGYNQATINLYQRASSAPSKPSSTLTYTFSTGALSGTLGNWQRTIPANTSGNPCYVTSVSVISRDATYSITGSSWSDPVKMVEDGVSVVSVDTVPSTDDDGYSTITITLSDGSSETFQVKNGSAGTSVEWFYGTQLTHDSGWSEAVTVTDATVGSMYLNTSTSNVYKLTSINGNKQRWTYAGNLLTGLIDVLEIGGTNLLSISMFTPSTSGGPTSVAMDGYVTDSTPSSDSRTHSYSSCEWKISLKAGTYTLSWEVGVITTISSSSIRIYKSDNTLIYYNESLPFNTIGTKSTTFTLSSDANIGIMTKVYGGKVRLKLEEGNISTSWSLAPQDAIAKIQQIYCRSNSSSIPSAPTAIVTNASDNVNYSSSNVNDTWTITRLPMIDVNNTNYKYCFTCEQMISVGGFFLGTTPVVADKAHTVIDGGNIITHSITSSQLATDAIQSLNYDSGSSENPKGVPFGSHYSATGTFLDLQYGDFYTPNFSVDSQFGHAYINGEIIATSGRIGSNTNTSWTIGTYTDFNMDQHGSIIGNGDAFIQSGKWMISGDRIDTRWYNNNLQLTYLYDSSTNTYYDYGINVPNLSSNTRLGDTFLYIRKHVGSIPVSDGDWTYLFRVAKDGTVYVNEVAIAGADGDFLSKSSTSSQTVAGSVTFTKQISGSITNAVSLSTSGTIRTNLASTSTATYTSGGNITPGVTGTLPVGNGGTGQTTAVNAANAFLNALSTGSSIPVDADYYISQYVNGGTTTTTYHRRPMSALWSYIKNKLSSDHSILDNLYVSISGGVINGSLVSDEIITGSLIVNGDARFVNAINGDLTGNASSATVALKVADSGNGTETTFAYSKSGLSTASWFAAWSGYELRAISPANVLTTIGADKSASISDRINVTSSGSYNWSSSTNDDKLITSNTLAYWNGAYNSSNHNSNIEYVKAGKLGDIVTHNASEFLGASSNAVSATKATNDSDNNKISDTYLKKSGGVMTGPISRTGVSTNWNKGRDNVLIKTTSLSGYSPLWSAKTNNGSWDVGTYDNSSYTDDLIFTYITDSDYANNNRTTAQIKFLENGHIVATLDGTASSANTLSTNISITVGNKTISNINAGSTASYALTDIAKDISDSSNPDRGWMTKSIYTTITNMAQNFSGGTITVSNVTASNGLTYSYNSTTGITSITGTYPIPTTAGTSEQILIADSNGKGAWNNQSNLKIRKLDTMTTTLRPTSANLAKTSTAALTYMLATSSMTEGKPMSDGQIICMDWDNNNGYMAQLYIPNNNSSTSHPQWRGQNGGTWGSWTTFLDSGNYNSYSPTLTGGNASGTWGISITGNAATATKATQDSDGKTINTTYLKVDGSNKMTNLLTLYREGTTANNYPAGIQFSVKDTTTGVTDNNASIFVYEDHASSAYGTNMVIRSGGGMFLGSGESPTAQYNAKGSTYDGEDTFITSDQLVVIQSNGNTIANRLGFYLDTSHNIIPCKADTATDNIGSIGTSSYKWANMYATTFHGALDGNATTATSATKLGSSTVGSTDRPIYLNAGAATQTTYRMASTNVAATTARAITDNLETGIWYVNGTNSTDLYSQSDGAAYVNKYSDSWIAEIYQDYRTGQIALRGKNNGTWQTWRKVLDSSNYTTWTVSLSGNQTIAGTKTFSSMILANAGIAVNNGSSTAGGIGLYSTAPENYGIAMRATTNLGKHGYVQGDWAIYNCMSGSDATNKLTRGWIWRNATDNVGVASISGAGNAVFNGSVTIGGNTGNTSGARMEFNSTTKSIDFIFN